MKKQTKAYLLTGLVIIFWATAASAFKIALSHVTPFALLFYSTLVSTVALFIIVACKGKLRQITRFTTRDWLSSLVLGLLNPFLYYVILFKAYDILPGQIAMSLNYGWPLVLTLLSVPILKQRLTLSQLLAVMVSFFGAVIIATRGEFTNFGTVSKFGVILAASSTLIWASFWLFNARDQRDPVIKLLVGFFFGFIFAACFNLMVGGLVFPSLQAWLPLIYVGLFEMGITFVLWLTALELTSEAARISTFIYITPFFSLLFLRLVVGEAINPATFVGLLLIVGAILFQTILATRKRG